MILQKIEQVHEENDRDFIGEYEIMNEDLGEGRYGIVKKATHAQTNKDYAVKLIHQENYRDQELYALLKTICIRSPFILNIHAAFQSKREETLYLVFDLCQGSINRYFRVKLPKISGLANRRLPERDALQIILQVTEGAIWLWDNKITHRDIKPDNILYRWDDNMKNNVFLISDFGLATMDNTLMSTYCGSPLYMAPEILRRSEKFTYLVDVWSLGIVFHEILFSKPPFIGKTKDEVLEKIEKYDYILTPDQKSAISPLTARLLESMIKKDPEKRITMHELADLLREYPEYDQYVRKVIQLYKPSQQSKDEEGQNLTKQCQEIEEQKQGYCFKDAQLDYARGLEANADKHDDNGFSKKAKEMMKEAVDIFVKYLGEEADETGCAMLRYAQILGKNEEHENAKFIGIKALKIIESNFKKDNLKMIEAYGIMGEIDRALGNYQSAREYLEKALNIALKINGEEHQETATVIMSLGNVLKRLQDFESARQQYERALRIKIKLFGENHIETATIYYNLALILNSLKEYENALIHCKKITCNQ